jgi:galactokinase
VLPPLDLALLAREAEHRYAGSPCGIMDQFICVLGRGDHALLLDCRSRGFEHLPLPTGEATWIVMDTQVKHNLGASEYPVRQQQCRAGVEAVRSDDPSVSALRDVSPARLEACRDAMSAVVYRRCRHVVTEIDRTREAAEGLRRGDLERFGGLMLASHASLRDDYEVSCPELDALVEIARAVPRVYGARMTGGGFGGCAIALARASAVDAVRAAVRERYDGSFDRPALVYTTRASDGATLAL